MKPTFRLEHARAGEKYTGKLIPLDESIKFTLLDIKFPMGLALVSDIKSGTISGQVNEPGEFDVVVKYARRGIKPAREEQGTARLLVVPNPKLMWKDIPTPRDAPYWVPDEKHSLLNAAGFTAIAASKRGRSHAHAGTFRDDDYALISDGNWLIAVVADGAGSAKYSRKGAQLACEHASNYLLTQLSKVDESLHATQSNPENIKTIFAPIIKASLDSALSEIKKESTQLADGSELREFSTTTLIVITRKLTDSMIAITYSVGDGAIAAYRENISVDLLSCADSGEYAGQTRFLDDNAVTLEEVERRCTVSFTSPNSSLILMSDGVSDPFFETDNELHNLSSWNTLWHNLKEEQVILGENFGDGVDERLNDTQDIRLLKWLDFWSKGNHDDRTIIIINAN